MVAKSELAVLKSSTTLYEKVPGTSPDSVYTVIMVLKNAAMAARLKHGTLSLRVEGDDLSTYAESLSSLGFSVKHSTHSSVHVSVSSVEDGNKFIGACAAMIGWKNVVKVGDLSEVG